MIDFKIINAIMYTMSTTRGILTNTSLCLAAAGGVIWLLGWTWEICHELPDALRVM